MNGGETSAMRIRDPPRETDAICALRDARVASGARQHACSSSLRAVDAVIDLREEIVPRLHQAQPALVELLPLQLIVQLGEAEQVLARAPDRVVDHRAGLHDEGPVARLREEELAGGLVQGAALYVARGVVMGAGELDHPLRCLVQVAVDPVVALVEPDAGVTARSPRRKRRL